MALTFDPENGEITTVFLLEQRELARRRARKFADIDRRVIDDAVSCRAMFGETATPPPVDK